MNVIFIFSDQHNPGFSGCYGGITRTPNIDSLAQGGVLFENAYSNCPLCVPSRASMFTGLYAHETASWDNTTPYDGRIPGLGHYTRENNIKFTTIGKLDFKPGADVGIDDIRCVRNRESLDVVGLFRDKPLPPRKKMHMASHWGAGPRENEDFLKHEKKVTQEAINWIRTDRPNDKPWVLNINYSKPHPAWHPDKELYKYYKNKLTSLGPKYFQKYDSLCEVDQNHSTHTCGFVLDDDKVYDCHTAYHATVEEVDIEIGKVLTSLKEVGIFDEVLIIYTSDHGEMARAHGAWGKCSMHEDSVRIPMIIHGPDVPDNKRMTSLVSLVDILPTISDALGMDTSNDIKGRSLLDVCQNNNTDNRYVFSESHSNGIIAGSFMVRSGDWKLIEYVGYQSHLFNLAKDPNEMNDLAPQAANDSQLLQKINELQAILLTICSPEKIDAKARADQQYLRDSLAVSGRLYDELELRGFQRIRDKLIPLPEYS